MLEHDGLIPWVVGIDLGATKIEVGLVSPDNRIVARQRIPTQADDGAVVVVERIAQQIDLLRAGLPAGASIAALGICSPGPLDHETGVLMDPPNLPGLHHAPLRQLLADRLAMPVALEHDAKAAAMGEFSFGAGQDAASMVYVVVGTGVGAAIILNGQVIRGEHNFAGEVGHMSIDRHGERCHCGSIGCAELFMSGPSLARRYQLAHPTGGPVTGERVSQMATAGDESAAQVMQEAGEALGVVVAIMAMTLNIDLYVIGGSVAKSGDLLLAPARLTFPHHCFQSVGENVRIVAAALDTDGPILGCAWLARRLLADR